MDDRNEEVLKQYDLKIYSSYRARGAIVLETNRGLKLYKSYEGSKNHLEFENSIKIHLYEHGYVNTDLFVRNLENQLISEDSQGNLYVIKNCFLGDECNLHDEKEVKIAASNLARLHNILQQVSYPKEGCTCYEVDDLREVFDKHNRELKRIRSYVKDKKQRNEFEICFLNSFDLFYEQALTAVKLLKEYAYDEMMKEAIDKGCICHGNYTYHNIIMLKDDVATVNFEKSCIGLQVTDLYYLIRKTMEKNNWDLALAQLILDEYCKVRFLTKDELRILYVMLLYPEKFWKVTNFYYNGKKSWVPQRNIQKIIHLQEQCDQKELFLKELKKRFL